MITWGISANSHDAALAVFDDQQLVFASHSERFSGIKNDPHLNYYLITYARNRWGDPDEIFWYENPYKKTIRQFVAGQGWLWSENNIRRYLSSYGIHGKLYIGNHHKSHAAAGYYTSTFDDACVVVLDSIGEFETLTIWKGEGDNLKKLYSQSYPHSVGLWYSAMTQRCGLKPNEEEYILMGMSALGDSKRFYDLIKNQFLDFSKLIDLKENLHKGCKDFRNDLTSEQDIFDIAAATQSLYEFILMNVLIFAKGLTKSKNLVLMGGCALNCVANSIAARNFENVWIMPNPGDAGSSIGAVLAHRQTHIQWPGALLGFDMGYHVDNHTIVDYILKNKISAVARGRAEFGPRALGNRSILADPRGSDVKDRVNKIKKREPFRPFAPAILEEYANEYFHMPVSSSPYMQFTARCKRPDLYPAIVHVDNTSRVQTVNKNDNPQFRELLELWYEKTGCPMLLNTSLNIKGQAMVNDHQDAIDWSTTYGLPIFT